MEKLKYIYLHLISFLGEREFDHKSVHAMDNTKDEDAWSEDHCSTFWGSGSERVDEGKYRFGDIDTSIEECKEITEEEYRVLLHFL